VNFTVNDDVYFNPQTKKVIFGRKLKRLQNLPVYLRPMKSSFIKIDGDSHLPRIARRRLARMLFKAQFGKVKV
jgi:hypothetical protein